MATLIDETLEASRSSDDNPQVETPETPTANNRTLWLGLVWGIAFGFLLQKGGVAKLNLLIGQLILADFTVLQIMLSAVIVGMLGIRWMHQRGMIELHLKPTRLVSNIVGGLLFGVGFALAAYCPGTGAAAIGQGNFDALAMVAGMIAGSYVFAEASLWISRKVDPIGDYGKLTAYDFVPGNHMTVTIVFALLLTLGLVGIEWFA